MDITYKGLPVTVYRPAGYPDCTNWGVTSRFDRCILVDPKLPEIFGEDDRTPALVLVRRRIQGEDYIHAVPADADPGKHYMFGGNFVYTSDSRLREAGIRGPVPVHDRTE